MSSILVDTFRELPSAVPFGIRIHWFPPSIFTGREIHSLLCLYWTSDLNMAEAWQRQQKYFLPPLSEHWDGSVFRNVHPKGFLTWIITQCLRRRNGRFGSHGII
jgi:hypothetical protein